MTHRIIPRSEWGARYANGAGTRKLPCQQTWLHHSVTLAPDLLPPFDDDYAAVRDLEKIGQSRFGRGISYTFLVTPAGLIFEGHSIDRIGAHTAGRNTIAAGICLIGNYDTKSPPTEMLDAVGWLLAHGYLAGWWDAVPLDGGHRDTKPTACPGRYAYAELENINGRAKAYANATPPPPPEDDMPPAPATCVDAKGNIWTFAKGRDNALYGQRNQEGWWSFEGILTSSPACSFLPRDGGDQIVVVARGAAADGPVWRCTIGNLYGDSIRKTTKAWQDLGGKS